LWACGTWLVWWPAAATTLLVNICLSVNKLQLLSFAYAAVIMLCILSLLASNSGNTAIQHDISQNNKQGSPTNHSSSFVPLHVGIFMCFAATRMYFPFV
jgi:multisubunit Na+/H+ antiporter MnhB subunit